VAGLSAKLSADGTRLELRFTREAAARAFAALNGGPAAVGNQPMTL
jgi:hypothetical protein